LSIFNSNKNSAPKTPNSGKTLVVGLTGGIASGKSTALKILQGKGALVISADAVYADLIAAKGGLADKIAAAFPHCVTDGSLDRRLLRGAVLGCEAARLTLEKIAHPAIEDEILRLIEVMGGGGAGGAGDTKNGADCGRADCGRADCGRADCGSASYGYGGASGSVYETRDTKNGAYCVCGGRGYSETVGSNMQIGGEEKANNSNRQTNSLSNEKNNLNSETSSSTSQTNNPKIENSGRKRVIVVEIPLFDKAKRLKNRCDFFVCITGPVAKRVKRLKQRGLSQTEVKQIILQQASEADMVKACEFVITNDGDLCQFGKNIDSWWASLGLD